ncbi:saccharopine dehydrogenase [Simkania negevensis]|uniref:Saccharopine dehydrogenase n=1 Tax=Simkania negevensis TaxID=83561 RepID=A0ABS3AVR4_9BACT|nr:saccharopine dehydrogenase [Simkania negevensis]
MTHLWLRYESKNLEKRTPLTPEHAAKLLEEGFSITVEESPDRIFSDDEYKRVGCHLSKKNSWPTAPLDAFILGIKELAIDSFPLEHNHVYFAHIYKGQEGADQLFQRFQKGGGVLYDLEYLVDSSQERIVSFGYWSGFAGAALSLLYWCHKQAANENAFHPPLFYGNEESFLDEMRELASQNRVKPSVLIIGAKGRCGRGVASLLEKFEIEAVKWDKEETQGHGPFREILNYDILFNCVNVNKKAEPFLTWDLIKENSKLSLIVDISCENTLIHNSLPIYEYLTSFANPCHRITGGDHPIDLIAIDHLPSFFPNESSSSFSDQLFPYLKQLKEKNNNGTPWKRAETIFREKSIQSIGQEM